MKHEDLILQQPQFVAAGTESARQISITGRFDQLVVCGIGGSGLPGEFLKFLIPTIGLSVPAFLNKGYSLPPQTSAKALVITVSYSGNPEETVSAYQKAIEREFNAVAISTNGQLEKLAQQSNLPFVKLPQEPKTAPRFALFAMLGALLQVLAQAGLVSQSHVGDFESVAKRLDPQKKKQEGKTLAEFLSGKIPLIYTSHRYKSFAINWKVRLNESSQIPCYTNYFSELNHDEIAGFGNKVLSAPFAVIIMKAIDENPLLVRRMNLTAELLEERGVPVQFVELSEQNIWERLMQNSLLGDWLALNLAEHYNVNPTTSEVIEEFKQKLKTAE